MFPLTEQIGSHYFSIRIMPLINFVFIPIVSIALTEFYPWRFDSYVLLNRDASMGLGELWKTP